MSSQGPIFLGYRLGHLQGDSRIFRALVYDKGAMVLHMLRRLIGDEAFFAGLRRFYVDHRFTKAGTAELQRAFEAETGRNLQQFFEGWIHRDELPVLTLSSHSEREDGHEVVTVRLQQTGRLFEFPVTVRLQLSDGSTREVIVPVRDRTTERRIPIDGRLRGIELNRDRAALLGGED